MQGYLRRFTEPKRLKISNLAQGGRIGTYELDLKKPESTPALAEGMEEVWPGVWADSDRIVVYGDVVKHAVSSVRGNRERTPPKEMAALLTKTSFIRARLGRAAITPQMLVNSTCDHLNFVVVIDATGGGGPMQTWDRDHLGFGDIFDGAKISTIVATSHGPVQVCKHGDAGDFSRSLTYTPRTCRHSHDISETLPMIKDSLVPDRDNVVIFVSHKQSHHHVTVMLEGLDVDAIYISRGDAFPISKGFSLSSRFHIMGRVLLKAMSYHTASFHNFRPGCGEVSLDALHENYINPEHFKPISVENMFVSQSPMAVRDLAEAAGSEYARDKLYWSLNSRQMIPSNTPVIVQTPLRWYITSARSLYSSSDQRIVAKPSKNRGIWVGNATWNRKTTKVIQWHAST